MLQIAMANEWFAGKAPAEQRLYRLALPDLRIRESVLQPDPACPACAGRYEYLDGSLDHFGASACAPERAEMQLSQAADLELIETKLAASRDFILRRNPFALIAEAGALRYTVFASGRLALEGSADPKLLQRFAQTYLGI
jgi:hypothetical protein